MQVMYMLILYEEKDGFRKSGDQKNVLLKGYKFTQVDLMLYMRCLWF